MFSNLLCFFSEYIFQVSTLKYLFGENVCVKVLLILEELQQYLYAAKTENAGENSKVKTGSFTAFSKGFIGLREIVFGSY